MILATDVHYFDHYAIAAGVLFKAWESSNVAQLVTIKVDNIQPYQSGQFYKRELPCLLALLEKIEKPLSHIIVDGFVHLDANKKAGLGKHLYHALEDKITIIGVAKNAYKDINDDFKIYRGNSKKPLYISAEGVDLATAKNYIQAMQGDFRLPTLLKRVDQLCREGG